MSDVVAYLESKGLRVKHASSTDVHVACPFCNEPESKRGRCYVNIDEGLYFCHLCGSRGNLRTLKKHYGDPLDEQDHTPVVRSEIFNAAAKYCNHLLKQKPDVMRYLTEERGLTPETIDKHLIGWTDGSLTQMLTKRYSIEELRAVGLTTSRGDDFLQDVITIPYLVHGNVVTIRGKVLSGKYKGLPNTPTRLYNSDSVWNQKDVVITEGEFDALIAEQLGHAAVGCPGANGFQEGWAEYFQDARRVFVVFDNDNAGRQGAEKIAKLIGPRARIANIPGRYDDDENDHNDLSDWVVEQGHTAEDFNAHLATFKGSILVTVADAFTEFSSLQGLEGLRLGIEDIDLSIRPGLLPGQVMVILAKSGAGKTISLLNLFHTISNEQPEAKILFCSLEQTRGDWFERARRIYAFDHLELAPSKDTPEAFHEFGERINRATIDYWRNRIYFVDKNRMREEDLLIAIEEFDEATGAPPDLIAIDYLGYWARAFPGKDRYERTSEAVMQLKELAKNHMIPILTPHQVNRGADYGAEPDVDAARDSGAVEETADFVFTLWAGDHQKGKEQAERDGVVNMRIGKSRHGNKGKLIKQMFGYYSLAMRPMTDPRSQWLRCEIDDGAEGDMRWERVIYRHAKGIGRTRIIGGSRVKPQVLTP